MTDRNAAPARGARPVKGGTLSLKKLPGAPSPLDDTTRIWPAFSSCPRGLESALADELSSLGAQQTRAVHGGVEFSADFTVLMRINLWSSLAGRVLMRLDHQPCTSESALYKLVKNTAWAQWFSVTQTFRTDLNNLGVELPNARLLQLRVKDAICDHFRDITGSRPNVDTDNPDMRVVVALGPTHASVYLDLSGENLFKRGWREDKGTAPLKENLAAGIIRITGWQGTDPLMDPFCGSGTLLIEAACKATDRAPGLMRSFAFEQFKGFDRAPWVSMKQDAQVRFENGLQQATGLQLVGSDITRLLTDIARHNARLAGLEPLLEDGRLRFEQRDARTIEPVGPTGLIVCNPPYGERLQAKGSSVEQDQAYLDLFSELGTRLKQQFAGWRFCCLTADLEIRKPIGLSPKRKTPLYNGPLECRLFEFPLAQGSYRPRASTGG